jgi:hypothetical protein
MSLEHTYTDLRGCKIPDARVETGLVLVGKTEAEVREFLGEDLSDNPGYFYYFLEGFAAHHNFQVGRI